MTHVTTPVHQKLQLQFDFEPDSGTARPAPTIGQGEAAGGSDVDRFAATNDQGDRPAEGPINVASGPPANLLDLYQLLTARAGTSRKNDQMRSALKTAGRVLGKPLDEIPADPVALRALLSKASPLSAGVTLMRWKGVKSLVGFALREGGAILMPGRDGAALAPEWQALADLLEDRASQYGISRLLHFFGRDGVEPGDLSLADFERFETALLTASLQERPEATYATAVRTWNRIVGCTPRWPQVHVPQFKNGKRLYSLPMDSYPESLRKEVEAFLAHSGNRNVLDDDYSPSVSPATVKHRKQITEEVAGALVASGFPADQITSLAVLTDLANAKAALRYLLDRQGGKPTPHIEQQAQLLHTLARYWLKDALQADPLKQLVSRLRVKKSGMSRRNKERLRQFAPPGNVDALLRLPPRVFREVKAKPNGTRNEAVRVEYALAIEILLMAPVRLKNLTGIEERHIKEVRRDGRVIRYLVIPAEEVKNNVPVEVELPQETCDLMDIYLKEYRPRLASGPQTFLFPGWQGARRVESSFSSLLSKFLRRETGLIMNPHLFRHFAVWFYLKTHPDGFEVVRRLLGHKSLETTMKYYAELDSDEAFKAYGALVLARRGGGPKLDEKRGKVAPTKKDRRS